MIDIYRMTPEQTVKMIEQLRVEVRWSKFDLLKKIREYVNGYWNAKLEAALADLVKHPGILEEVWWELVKNAPFRIKLDNLDDREGCVMVEAESKILAVHDQSIAGSKWEAPDDMDIAYAMPMDHPGLLEELKKENYDIDDSEYCPPDPLPNVSMGCSVEKPTCGICGAPFNQEEVKECPHGNPIGECDACDVQADLAFDADREDRFR